MIIKIEEYRGKRTITTIDNITNLKQTRVSYRNKYEKEELKEPNIEKYVTYNDIYKDRENQTWSDNTMLTALILERNGNTLEPECHLIYDSKGDVLRCTVWFMNDNGVTIDRMDF